MKQGIAEDCNPFKGIKLVRQKAEKQSLTVEDMKVIKTIDLLKSKTIEWARDIFMLSFYGQVWSLLTRHIFAKKTSATE